MLRDANLIFNLTAENDQLWFQKEWRRSSKTTRWSRSTWFVSPSRASLLALPPRFPPPSRPRSLYMPQPTITPILIRDIPLSPIPTLISLASKHPNHMRPIRWPCTNSVDTIRSWSQAFFLSVYLFHYQRRGEIEKFGFLNRIGIFWSHNSVSVLIHYHEWDGIDVFF